MKKNILFVTELYCERNGPKDQSNYTNSFHNLFETADAIDLFNRDHIWLDELEDDSSIDSWILHHVDNKKTDIIFYSYYGCDYSLNPNLSTIAFIKECYSNIKQVHIFWDSSHSCIQQQVKDLAQFTDLQINVDGTELGHLADNTFFCGCPQSPRLFYKDEQDTDISFVGRTEHYAERCHYLGTILDKGFKLNIAGGRTQQNLSMEDYAKEIRRSKININFNKAPAGMLQIKGRIWEILQSETLLLEQYNPLLHKYLTPGVDYIEFNSPEDLMDKAQYYLTHEDERHSVIASAKKKFEQYYNYKVLWNKINEL